MSFGLELLFSSLTLQTKNDAIVAAVHWSLIQNGFLCVSAGDESQNDESQTELLPRDWNSSTDEYKLRYVRRSSKEDFAVQILPVDKSILINITNATDKKYAALALITDDYVGDLDTYNSAYKDVEKLNQAIQTELVDKLIQEANNHSSRDSCRESCREVLAEEMSNEWPPDAGTSSFRPIRFDSQNVDPHAVGRADLDPFGGWGAGGGMLMDPHSLLASRARPRQDPSLPRGAAPPGARFDPFGPPMPGQDPRGGRNSLGRFGVPNPDHLPPPSYFDDMF